MEVVVNGAPLHQSADTVFVKAIREYAVFVHEIGDEDQSAGLCHTLRFVESLEFLIVADEMIERAEEESDVGRCRIDVWHVARVALHDVGVGLTLEEDLYVVSYKFDGFHLVALCHQGRGVASCTGADVEQL